MTSVCSSSIMSVCLRIVVPILVLICAASSHGASSKLILISMDSLMYKFIENAPLEGTENFQYIIKNGVLLKELMNVYPSSTYPNHYSILTGLYPESHGLVSNFFYDNNLNEYFSWSVTANNLDSKWYDVGAEPIYVTNTKAGGGRRSGSLLFPTGLATVKGVAPDVVVENDGTYSRSYNGAYGYPYVNMSYTDRVDRIISWFTDKQHPINLALLYFPEPDEMAHVHGPASDEVQHEITGPLNSALGYLIKKLRETKLFDSTNIILTADHGHTLRTNFVHANNYVDPKSYTTYGGEGIWPKTGMEDDIIRNLSAVAGIRVYKKGGPELKAMHYSNNIRVAPLVLEPDLGVVIVRNQADEDAFPLVGVHGYDPVRYPVMRPVFMAMGPAFKNDYVSERPFKSLDLYPLMCHLLDLDPAPNNGSLDNVRHLLVDTTSGQGQKPMSLILLIGGILVGLLYL